MWLFFILYVAILFIHNLRLLLHSHPLFLKPPLPMAAMLSHCRHVLHHPDPVSSRPCRFRGYTGDEHKCLSSLHLHCSNATKSLLQLAITSSTSMYLRIFRYFHLAVVHRHFPGPQFTILWIKGKQCPYGIGDAIEDCMKLGPKLYYWKAAGGELGRNKQQLTGVHYTYIPQVVCQE